MKTIFELLDELSNYSNADIEFALCELMMSGKIDFVNLSNSYVKMLNFVKNDQLNKLIEAETCIMESFIYKKGNKQECNKKHTQRCLYLINKSNRFNIQKLNEKYEYDEEFGKSMSWYERNKLKNNC